MVSRDAETVFCRVSMGLTLAFGCAGGDEPAQNQPQQSSSTCLCKPTAAPIAFALARHFQQFFDQAGCFEFVERLDRLAKAILGQCLDLGLFQFGLLDDLEDEALLFVRAVPARPVSCAGPLLLP